jgi:hypothetical protein
MDGAQELTNNPTLGPLVPPTVKQIYLTNNTWDIGKNYYGEAAIFGDIKATLPLLNDLVRANPPAGAAERNERLRQLDIQRRIAWEQYLAQAMTQKEIWAVAIAAYGLAPGYGWQPKITAPEYLTIQRLKIDQGCSGRIYMATFCAGICSK